MIDLSLILHNASDGICSISKESRHAAVLLSIKNETQCVPLLCLSRRFITYAPSFILSKLFIDKTPSNTPFL